MPRTRAFGGVASATVVVVFVLCLLAPGSALAGTLDQQQTTATGPDAEVYSNEAWAQTFTAGLSGGLDQVDLNLAQQIAGNPAPTTPLTVEIQNVSGGVPGGTVLGTQSIAPATPPVYPANGFVSVNFAPAVPVVAGTQYAIVVSTTAGSSGEYGWYGAGGDTYTGGDPFFQQPPNTGPWDPPSTLDLAFRTYVATSAPPAPTPPAPTPPAPTRPGKAVITKGKIKTKKHNATFSFTASGATRFQCELIKPRKKPKATFSSCSSPKTYKHLKPGHYTFKVRGINSAGTGQATPKKFKI